MEKLFKDAFEAGKDLGHAMATGKPTYGLNFNEWYTNQVLRIHDVVRRNEQFICGRQDLSTTAERCLIQCEGCRHRGSQ